MKTKIDVIDNLRKARNINDLKEIVNGIITRVRKRKKFLKKVLESLSKNFVSESAKKGDVKIGVDVRVNLEEMLEQELPTTVETPVKPTTKYIKYNVEKWQVPDLTYLRQAFLTVDEYHKEDLELQHAEAMLIQGFGQPTAAKKTLLNQIRSYRKEIKDEINAALETLKALSAKKSPRPVKSMTKKIISHLESSLPEGSYKKIEPTGYVVPSKRADSSQLTLEFVVYVRIYGLKNDENYVFPEYYIVLTGIIDENGTLRFHVTSLHDFKMPGTFQPGKNVSSNNVLQEISDLIAYANVHSKIERLPFTHTTTEFRKRGITAKRLPGIVGVRVTKDDRLLVGIRKDATPAEIGKISKIIYHLIFSIMGDARREKITVQRKIHTSKIDPKTGMGKGNRIIEFIVTSNLPPGNVKRLNVEKMELLRDLTGMSEDEYLAFKRTLRNT